jgi:hypothetical protein
VALVCDEGIEKPINVILIDAVSRSNPLCTVGERLAKCRIIEELEKLPEDVAGAIVDGSPAHGLLLSLRALPLRLLVVDRGLDRLRFKK